MTPGMGRSTARNTAEHTATAGRDIVQTAEAHKLCLGLAGRLLVHNGVYGELRAVLTHRQGCFLQLFNPERSAGYELERALRKDSKL